ncbi:AAA family ATPase [Streptomyces sp. NPDC093568]|uniref:helix-turn-helix transcriptional regulator n=1 Tax=Streptomyces sp. NPDC093568 TaxID=3366041 RepID=UPI003805A042
MQSSVDSCLGERVSTAIHIPSDHVKSAARQTGEDSIVVRISSQRSGQLATLQELFNGVRLSGQRTVLVKGPVGTGKTELLNAFSSHVTAAGGLALLAATSRAEQQVPFAVLAHLFRNAPISAGLRARIAELVDEGQGARVTGLLAASPGPEVAPQTFHRMCMALTDLVEQAEGPLVLAVDDVQYADLPSLRCLSFVARRMRSARLMLVLSESPHIRRHAALSEAELPPEPAVVVVQLPLLSPSAVEEAIAERLGRERSHELGAGGYAVSGGNPMLLSGFIEDNRRTTVPRSSAHGATAGFRQALIACLYRHEPEVLQVAFALSVLKEALPVAQLAQLADTDTETTAHALEILRECGIVSDGLPRHPQTRAAVLEALTAEERSELQLRAANVQLKSGSPVTSVAEQILAADRIESECAVPVLHEAAELALDQGQVEFAANCLRLAQRYDSDDRSRAATMARLVQATWRVEPYLAYRRISTLVADARTGVLPLRHISVATDGLLWFGQPEEAAELLRERGGLASSGPAHQRAHLEVSRAWLGVLYPDWAVGGIESRGGVDADSAEIEWLGPETRHPEGAIRLRHRAIDLLDDMLATGVGPGTVREALHVLRHHSLDEDSLMVLLAALHVLVTADQLQEARQWTAELLVQARRQSAVVWEAVLTAFAADIALRSGEPRNATRHVRRALELLPARNWGVLLGLPLAVAIATSALTGSDEEWIDEVSAAVPRAIFATPLGLRLLRARGRRALTYHPSTALEDFLVAGELAERWGMGHPAAVPWRTDAAQAYLRLGDVRNAKALASEQLRLCGPEHPRVHAETLRVLAACGSPAERLKLLTRASELLQQCDAPLELAMVLHDLGWAQQEQGQYSKGRLSLRRARLLAEERGVRLPASPLGAARSEKSALPPSPTKHVRGGEVLSDAEMRVARLAVRGHSNRQIAGQLYVTVSTVEQHLTRVYRKLNIKRRTDLGEAIQYAARAESSSTAC